MILKIFKFDHAVSLPIYGTSSSSGLDLHAAIDKDITIKSFERLIIPTGIAVVLPNDVEDNRYEIQIRSRSGLSFKNGIVVLNSPGTIDSDYHEEIKVVLMNMSKDDFIITKGMRIAQMVVSICKTVELSEINSINDYTKRGGFGSTGL